MSSGANVKRVAILRELNRLLVDFSQTASSNLQSNQREIYRTLDWLSERERYWRNQMQSSMDEVQRAKRAYANSNDDGRRQSYNRNASAVASAQREFEKAREELNNVREWRQRVENKISAYICQAGRLQRTVNTTLCQASTFLKEKVRILGDFLNENIIILDDYCGIQSPNSINVIGKRGYAFDKAKQDMLENVLDDPLEGRYIKGWVLNEKRRIKQPGRNKRIRMPGICRKNEKNVPDFDAGHRLWGVHHWSNLRFELCDLNRTRYYRAVRRGIGDRIH